MSIDLAVWSKHPSDLPRQFPKTDSWTNHGKEFAFDGDEWQVIVLCASEQPNSSVMCKLAQAKHVVYVTLEPIGADPAGYTMLEDVIRGLSRETGGVWVGPDGDAYYDDEEAF